MIDTVFDSLLRQRTSRQRCRALKGEAIFCHAWLHLEQTAATPSISIDAQAGNKQFSLRQSPMIRPTEVGDLWPNGRPLQGEATCRNGFEKGDRSPLNSASIDKANFAFQAIRPADDVSDRGPARTTCQTIVELNAFCGELRRVRVQPIRPQLVFHT
jgi:hypothetical protein